MSANSESQELSPIKQALLEIRNLRAQLDAVQIRQHEPIAIVGTGLRFPGGVNDLQSFWLLLEEGTDAITEIPPERWNLDDFYDPDITVPGKMITRFGGFLKDVDQFSPGFFGISPREAESLDPQQRLLLEVTWEALENAGQSPEKLAGSQTGVFIGIANSDYSRMVLRDFEKIDTYATTGGSYSVASGRISYLLGLHGPAVSVDTACSSSLVAAHLACQSLRRGECNLAIVGGVNLTLTPEANINFSKAGMMAPDGRCKTFDARADGYVRGEGCAAIVLKRLSDAQASGDHILATIRGSAINQDGRSNGLTAPNGPSQEAVIRAALADAGLEPDQIKYIETHGTGTSLGDPIEVHALGAVYNQGRDPSDPLKIGSVKTNFGHLEAAAGLAGLVKLALSLKHREIPPHLHFETPNPHINWDKYMLEVVTSRTPWEPINGHRIGGVSSFGFSGTNAHVILEEPPTPEKQSLSNEQPVKILALSSQSTVALRELVERYEQYIKSEKSTSLADIAFTANTGRVHLSHRLAIKAADIDDLTIKLSSIKEGKYPDGVWQGQFTNTELPVVAFLFTGYGTHYPDMGRQLYETQPTFRRVIDACDELLRPVLPVPLIAVMYPDRNSPIEETASNLHPQIPTIDNMTYGQPAIFALQMALATLWKSWGIEPMAVAGHSVGEYAAACIAGVLSLENALKLVAQRGDLMQDLPEDGEMVTVFAEENRVVPIIEPYAAQVSIAAVNSPETVVISGKSEAVLEAIQALKAEKIRVRRLNINRAAHSPMVDPMLPGIAEATKDMQLSIPEIEFFSTVTGNTVRSEITQPEYWQRHLRQTVRFADTVGSLYEAGYRIFLEIGPNPTLLSLGQRSVPETESTVWLPSLREGWDDWDQILESLAQLYVHGVSADWDGFEKGYGPRQKLALPTYPWQRQSYWWKMLPKLGSESENIWDQVVSTGRQQAQQIPIDLDISSFSTKWEALNLLAVGYINNALVSLGAFQNAGDLHTPDSLIENYKIKPYYRALLQRWLNLLKDANRLHFTSAEKYACSEPLEQLTLDELIQTAYESTAEARFVTDYVCDCGEHLASIITGQESPLEMMFPDGSMTRAEELYQHWAHARYFHNIVSAVAKTIAHARPGKNLRILEIGAGIGSTTSAALPVIPPARTEFHYTDVSDLFLNFARQKFAAYPFVKYGILDIEKDGLSQGYGRSQFDIILAGNVIHATRSLRETLQNVRDLLSPDGFLIQFEATAHQPWYDITTGLIEGWQSFGDEYRTESPLLHPEIWVNILSEAGFDPIAVFPETGSPAEILGEHVLIAHNPAGQGQHDEMELTVDAASDDPSLVQETNLADELIAELQAALPEERRERLMSFVRSQIMSVLRLESNQAPNRKARLMDLGVDSLMAVELRGRLTKGLKLERKLPATLIFDYPTIESITDYLLNEILIFESEAENTPSAEETSTSSTDIESLSDDDVEAMLLEKLKKLK